jgi:hypothetical protein
MRLPFAFALAAASIASSAQAVPLINQSPSEPIFAQDVFPWPIDVTAYAPKILLPPLNRPNLPFDVARIKISGSIEIS